MQKLLKLAIVFGLLTGLLGANVLGVSSQETLTVIAAHGIIADVASNVAGEQAQVSSLLPIGKDPHTFIPTPRDLTAVAQADVFFVNGAGHEGHLLEALAVAGETIGYINLSDCLHILPQGAATHDEHDEHDDHDDEHDDDHADDHDDHDDEHDDDHADEHDDDHADDHADEHDDDHADEHDDDHAHDEHDDDHADEHDDDHAHDDDHDDDHADEHDHDDMGRDCAALDAEYAQLTGADSHDHDHDDEHEHIALGRGQDIDCSVEMEEEEGHDDHDHHGHDHGICDPHVWMDPHQVIYWTLDIRDALAAADPANAEAYAANAAAYIEELIALEKEFILPALENLPPEQRVLATSHETLGYLAVRYGFEIVAAVNPSVSTEMEASARDIAEVIETVRERGVPAIFSDTFAQDNVMQAIAAEAGITLASLYSDTLSGPDGPAGTYLDYMRYNVGTIVDGLAG